MFEHDAAGTQPVANQKPPENCAMPRFSLIRHDDPRGLHWDLFLQEGSTLRTWALPRPPSPNEEIACEQISDHRLEYLDYEGPVSGNRGTVSRWDTGTMVVLAASEEAWMVELRGTWLAGRVRLWRIASQPPQWKVIFTPSE